MIGTVEILVTVECRRRSTKADVRWIEELRSKRDSLGISKTIAVSKRGFSRDAVETARLAGIELRTLSEITSGQIKGWILPEKITYTYQHFDITAVDIDAYPGGHGAEVDQPVASISSATTADVFETRDGTRCSLNDLFRTALRQEPALAANVPADGTRKHRTVHVRFRAGDLSLYTDTGPVGVARVAVSVDLWEEEQVQNGASGSYHRYLDSEGRSVERAEFRLTAGSSSVRFGVQHESTEGGVKLSIESADSYT